MTTLELRLGHSPDPDDAFMWWPLIDSGDGSAIETGRFRFETVAEDIEALNRRSETGDLEITAMSCAQYARVRDTYALTACGASLGNAYGPKLVAPDPRSLESLRDPAVVIAVPGVRTSAFGMLNLILGPGRFRYAEVPFEDIIERVAGGEFDAGLVIHEGQLTFADLGLHLVVDVGTWWHEDTGLPLPLGVNAIHRTLEARGGPGTLAEVTRLLRRSVEHALAHRPESIAYALRFARGMSAELADEFVGMYVNRWTLDFGTDGRRAVEVFLGRLHAAAIVPDPGSIDFIAPAV